MATTPTTTVTALARRYRIDIDTATSPAVNYEQLYRVEDAKLIEERRTEEDEFYDDDGALREAVTGQNWRIEAKIGFSTNADGTAVDAVHAFLRTMWKAHRTASVTGGEFGIRWYDRDGLDDGMSSEGRVYVKSWVMSGGKGRETVDLVLQGQGKISDITNPDATLVPAVTGLDPAAGAAAGDNHVSVFGQHFKPNGVATVSGVDFGANPAVDFTVVSDSHIVATAPAGAAGVVAVRVTTAAGQSADTAADDYTYA